MMNRVGAGTLVFLLSCWLSAKAQHGLSPPESKQACEERVLQLLRDLPPGNHLRELLKTGFRISGPRYPWMDRMRAYSIRQVNFRLRYEWVEQMRMLEIVEVKYLRQYWDARTAIRDAEILRDIADRGLENELRGVALDQARSVLAEGLRDAGFRRARGSYLLVLVDDECVPAYADDIETIDLDFTDLMRAAHEAKIEEVKTLLAQGADVNARDHLRMTALMYAAIGGQPEVLKVLIEAGADISAVSKGGETALMMAAGLASVGAVEALVEGGADVNQRDPYGGTALLEAARSGCVEIVKILLGAGADPNRAGVRGSTPLMEASRLGHIEIVRDLLAAGADPNFRDADGNTALGLVMPGASQAVAKPALQETIKLLMSAGGRE